MKLVSAPALLLGTTLLLGQASAQALVRDINTVAVNPGSSPAPIKSVLGGTVTFFGATDGVNGVELWRSDGTPAGTFMVKDINPGAGNSSPTGFFSFGPLVLFAANDGTNGSELWVSDGTAAGTTLLKDINPGSGSSSPTEFTTAGSFVVFRATDGTGAELWRTDFSAAGTVQVLDINTTTPTAGSFPNRFVAFNGMAYFAANNGLNGTELWRSDGTPAGTTLVADINITTPTASGFPTSLVASGSRLYFFADDGSVGNELWSTDGTTTALVKDINPGSASSGGIEEVRLDVGGVLLFTATEASIGHELWRTDGTAAGTTLVKDINPGAGNGATSTIGGAVLLGSTMLLAADDGVNGVELWRSDGTAVGTTLVLDIAPGAADSGFPQEMVANNGIVYMSCFHPTYGVELWKTDGTAAGTQLLRDIYTGIPDGIPRFIAPVGTKVVFQAIELVSGNREPWVSDGTTAGTFLLGEINPPSPTATGNANPTNLVSFNGKLYFAAGDGVNGTELWVSDGTLAGTQMVLDINPGAASGFNGPIRVFGDKLVFAATTVAAGTELWLSDGTAAGTSMIRDLNPGPENGYNPGSANLVVFGGRIIFTGNDGVNGSEIWASDGTVAGTQLLLDISAGAGSSSPSNLTVTDDLVYFQANDDVNNTGLEPYRTDGTPGGTGLLLDINAGAGASSFPSAFTSYNGRVYFAGTTAAAGAELWSTDGTAGGTTQVLDIRPGTGSSFPSQFFVFGGKLFFSANDGSTGTELWSTDGTVANTALFLDIHATSSSSPTAFVNANGTMFFRAGNSTNGTELWRSDGTVAGTSLVADIQPGTGSGYFSSQTFQAGSGTLVLIAGNSGTSGAGTGSEVWRSDGTVAGTTQVADINPGTASSSPSNFTRVGSRIFFTANDGVKGIELWSVSLRTLGAPLVENIGRACPGTGGLRPVAGASGLPTRGNTGFAVTVADGRPNSACVLLLSAATTNISLGSGCFLYVVPPTIDLFTGTDALGNASVGISVPANPSLLGGELWWQWAIVDPAGAFRNLLSISDGLHTVIGN